MQPIDKLISIEEKLGFKLPEDYKQFLLDEAGHSQCMFKVYPRVLQDGWKTDGIIEKVTSVDTFWQANQYREYLREFQEHFENPASYVESEYLYVIMSGTGVVCMAMSGTHKGKIYSVDNGDFGIVYQTDNLEQFLQSLY
ncbi:MAG: SMI1/KNR4 family protein [Niastella sp.]|nr:SMI1/KNR4 family protein [Niastella sp.]